MKDSDFGLILANMYIAGMAIPEWAKVTFMILWLAYGLYALKQGN